MANEVPAQFIRKHLSNISQKRPRALLPVVQRMLQQLNALFLEFTGPVGTEIIEPLFEQWIHNGKVGPSGLRIYAKTLSEELEDSIEREHFNRLAEKILLGFSDVSI